MSKSDSWWMPRDGATRWPYAMKIPGLRWSASVAPPFRIEGQPLRAFLEHVRDEHGWTIVYADRGVEDSANRILLHGSVDGLSAEDAVRVVLATSGLRYRLSAGELFISRAGATR